jgi:hypothetical protein
LIEAWGVVRHWKPGKSKGMKPIVSDYDTAESQFGAGDWKAELRMMSDEILHHSSLTLLHSLGFSSPYSSSLR